MNEEHKKTREGLLEVFREHYHNLFKKFYTASAFRPEEQMQVTAEAFGINLPEVALEEMEKVLNELKESKK